MHSDFLGFSKLNQNNPADIAFLDINMRGMGGLALAERIIADHTQSITHASVTVKDGALRIEAM